VESFNIQELVLTRTDQRSFHIVSEPNVRIEFRNMAAGERLDPFAYAGALVVTCFRGAFLLQADAASKDLVVMEQAVVSANERVLLECTHDGTVQIIWSPPFAATTKR
jgi:hypothetical protein